MTNKMGTTTPGRGYEDVVKRQGGTGDTSGRAVPDERRTQEEGHRDNLQAGKESALPAARKPAEEDDAER